MRTVLTSALAALLIVAALDIEARAALSAVGEVTPVIDPLGYGITGQPASIGGDVTIGLTDVGGLFINQQFEPGPLINSGDGIIGEEQGSVGAVDMTDFGSDWLMGGDLIVGQEGTGTLDIKDSAKVQVGNTTFSETTIPRSDPPSTVITNGGLATIGQFNTGLGTITLSGVASSRLIVEDLIVGDYGVGNLIATSRANVYTQKGFIGNGDGSVGYVSISDLGTRWTVGENSTSNNMQGRLTIGNLVGQGEVGEADGETQEGQGQGTLRIANQGLVQVSDEVVIGLNGHLLLETKGRLRILSTSEQVNDLNSTFLDTITNLGVISGDGFVDFVGVRNGPTNPNTASTRPLTMLNSFTGEIRNSSNAYGQGGTGTIATNQREKLVFNGNALNFDVMVNLGLIESLGGEMEFNVPVDNTLTGNIVARDAVMRFNNGLTDTNPLASGHLTLGGASTIYGNISNQIITALPGSVTVVVGGILFSGPLSDLSGNSEVAALLTGPGLSLAIGDNPSSFTVIGNLDLTGGTLDLDVSTLGVPQVGDVFEVMNIPGATGNFGAFDNTQVIAAGNQQWNISYDSDSVFVTFAGLGAGPIGADFNGDGVVDAADLAIWQANYGATAPPDLSALGDADGDGDVDGRDFLKIQQQMGGPGVPLSALVTASSVPEPGTIVLLLTAALAVVNRRK